jgi:hypothetical protein
MKKKKKLVSPLFPPVTTATFPVDAMVAGKDKNNLKK